MLRSTTHRPPRSTSGRITAEQRDASLARTLSRARAACHSACATRARVRSRPEAHPPASAPHCCSAAHHSRRHAPCAPSNVDEVDDSKQRQEGHRSEERCPAHPRVSRHSASGCCVSSSTTLPSRLPAELPAPAPTPVPAGVVPFGILAILLTAPREPAMERVVPVGPPPCVHRSCHANRVDRSIGLRNGSVVVVVFFSPPRFPRAPSEFRVPRETH